MKSYYLWRAHGNKPHDAAPLGQVRTAFEPLIAFFSPQNPHEIVIFACDEETTRALTGLDRGDLVFGSIHDSGGYQVGFGLRDVRVVRAGDHKFRVTVSEGEVFRPLPDAFEWPRPAPPPPTEEELEAARQEELRREQSLIMTDPGMMPVHSRHDRRGRRIRRQGSTMTRAR